MLWCQIVNVDEIFTHNVNVPVLEIMVCPTLNNLTQKRCENAFRPNNGCDAQGEILTYDINVLIHILENCFISLDNLKSN